MKNSPKKVFILYKLTYKQFGKRAILIEWPAKIQEDLLYDIIRFKEKIIDCFSGEVEDCIVGYNSLVVKFQADLGGFDGIKNTLEGLYHTPYQEASMISYLWEIPVCYDAKFGIDLNEMSVTLDLPEEEIIARHSKAIYTVYFIGFLPGFLYLGGLDKLLHIPRKATPRLRVKKGAVAIGGHQTGIYPMESAGGWHIIGNTPVSLFDLKKTPPCFAKSGDKIKFSAVSIEEYIQLNEMLDEGNYELSKQQIHA